MSFAYKRTQSIADRNLAFLKTLRIDHEPVSLLGGYFAEVAAFVEAHSIGLSLETAESLMQINRDNESCWRRIIPVFDPVLNDLDEGNTRVLVARNEQGEAVATGACRLYDWEHTNYAAELESLRMFSRDPSAKALPYKGCAVTAHRARAINGKVVFAGAAWCHPSVRGKRLSSVIPRASKALAVATWDFDFMVGLMLEEVVAMGFAERFGYHDPEQGAVLADSSGAEKRFAVLSMSRYAVVNHVDEYLSRRGSKTDRSIWHGLA